MAHDTSIDSLPKDLCCAEILTRLDPESLYNCKRVSKSWYDLIKNRSFTQLYSEKRPKVTAFFFQSSDMYPEKLQFVSIYPNQEYISDPPACLGFLDSPAILQNSCNGLLLWLVGNSRIIVSNPLASRCLPIIWTFDFLEIFAYGVAIDPLVSDHFKFVVFVEETKGCYKVKVFSSEGLNWSDGSETRVVNNRALPYSCARGVYLNGILYWELRDHSLLAYDVGNEIDCVMRLPLVRKKTRSVEFREPGCLGVSKGKLWYCRVIGTVVNVWQTKQMPLARSGNWVVKHKINLCGVMRDYPEMKFRGSQALAFLNDCREILLSIKHGVIEFSFGDNAVRSMYKARRYMSRKNVDASEYVQPSMFFPFVQSLALFNL
ncbi:putative F-box protein At3g16210 [Apium graveolens]|uniref:putative F-box protein At3g16210 n=1 Tax=Apium graveolens TaxID=4045 RepID=UPI003D7B2999